MATVVDHIERQVRVHPQAPAVQDLTYKELNERANRFAWGLLEQGLRPQQWVVLEAPRSALFLAALLGILKAGGVYVPLDPQGPPERRQRIVEQLPGAVFLRAQPQEMADSSHDPNCPSQADDLAYLLFTSGSTGVPKGAMLEHAGLLNHLQSKVEDFGLRPGVRVAQTAPASFDISVWQLLAPLLGGACCCIFEDTLQREPEQFMAQLKQRQVHVLELVPAHIQALLNAPGELPDLRYLLPTGEVLRPALCQRWLKRFPHTQMVNAYGPTECCDDVTLHFMTQIPDLSKTSVPLGKPIRNVQIHLLDESLEEVAEGQLGEICVGGVAVGRGYLHDAEKTDQAFVNHPVWGRIYRTGDLGCYQEGQLYFVERRDFQVKVRGVRLELGEVEAALLQFPGVEQVAAQLEGEQLVAYLAPEYLPLRQLGSWIQEKLPQAFQPNRLVFLPRLPLTSSGKVDRKALPEQMPTTNGQGPRDAHELALLGHFQEALGLSPLSVHDDFFACGGHSLSALDLLARVHEQWSITPTLSQLLSCPTVASFAQILRQPENHSLRVQLKAGEGVPWVLFPGAGGNLVYLYDLVQRLPGPIMGFQARGLQAGEVPFSSVEEAAESYLPLLPPGPIRLLGHSVGGWIAFEIARRREVDQLVILDMPCPWLGQSLQAEPGGLKDLGEMIAAFYNKSTLPTRLEKAGLAEVAEWLQSEGILPPHLAQAQLEGLLQVYRSHQNLRYAPEAPYPDSFQLILTLASYRPQIPWLGWEKYCRGLVRLHLVHGDHLSCLRPPVVDELVDKIRSFGQ